jgi:hypothetical protein
MMTIFDVEDMVAAYGARTANLTKADIRWS